MKFKVNALKFKQLIESVSKLINEPTLRFGEGKVQLTHIDPTTVAMVHQECQIKGNKKIEVTVKSQNLLAHLTNLLINKEDELELSFTNKEKLMLVITHNKTIATFNHIESDYGRDTKIPQFKFPTKIQIERTDLIRAINLCDILSDAVKFVIKNGKFLVQSSGEDDNQTVEVAIKTTKLPNELNILARYSIEYLKKVVFHTSKIDIEFNTDYPLRLSDAKGNWVILAPRVDNYKKTDEL